MIGLKVGLVFRRAAYGPGLGIDVQERLDRRRCDYGRRFLLRVIDIQPAMHDSDLGIAAWQLLGLSLIHI